VQPSEITKAEEKGKSLISFFNSLEFRELCLTPGDLPEVKELKKAIQSVFSDVFAAQQRSGWCTCQKMLRRQ